MTDMKKFLIAKYFADVTELLLYYFAFINKLTNIAICLLLH